MRGNIIVVNGDEEEEEEEEGISGVQSQERLGGARKSERLLLPSGTRGTVVI